MDSKSLGINISLKDCSDLANARRLIAGSGGFVRFVPEWGEWVGWNGKVWEQDARELRLRALCAEIADHYWAESEMVMALPKEMRPKTNPAGAIFKKISSKTGAKAAIDSARSVPGVVVPSDALNAKPKLLNVANGKIDLRTGVLQDHDPKDLLTKVAPVVYDPDARCPRWETFIHEVMSGDDEKVAYLQRLIGYSITGETREQCLFVFTGGGANGKTVLANVLLQLLGGLACQTPPRILVAKALAEHPTELMSLYGVRLGIASELEGNARLAEAQAKQLTGGDRIVARKMRQDFFSWVPTHKLILLSNHLPQVYGTDDAIWRRIKILRFEESFTGDRCDPKLPEKLNAELSGILNWAIQGCLDWQREGLRIPSAVVQATNEYRREQDTLGIYLDERCVADSEAVALARDLYKDYETWAKDGGFYPLNKKNFGQRLEARGFKAEKGTRGVRIRRGLRLVEAPAFDLSRVVVAESRAALST